MLLGLQRRQLLPLARGFARSRAVRSRRSSSSAAACSANCSACCSLLANKFGQRLPPGKHRFIELGDLRFAVGELLARFRQQLLAFLLAALAPAPSAAAASRLAARTWRAAICCSVAAACNSRMLLLKRRRTVARLARKLSFKLLRPSLSHRSARRPLASISARSAAIRSSVRAHFVFAVGRCSSTIRSSCAADAAVCRWHSASSPAAAVYAATDDATSASCRVRSCPIAHSTAACAANCCSRLAHLFVTRPQLAAPRQHAVAACRGPTTSVPSAAKQFAVARDKFQTATRRLRQPQCRRQPIDKPRAAQQPPRQRLIFRRRFDESIGPPHHARFGRKVDMIERRQQVAGCRAPGSRHARQRASGWPVQPLEQLAWPTPAR